MGRHHNGRRAAERERQIAEHRWANMVERHTLAGLPLQPTARALRESRNGR